MKNKIIIFLVALFALSCQKEKISYILLSGTIENNNMDTITVKRGEFIKKIPVLDKTKVHDTLRIDENGFYYLNIGREYASIYLEQGGGLNFSVDAKQFDETMNFEGTNAASNIYLNNKVLLKEKILGERNEIFKLEEDEYINTLNKYEDSLNSLLSKNTFPNDFITSEKKNITFEKAYKLNNYERYHRYMTNNQEFKVSDTYLKNLEDLFSGIDFNNEVDYRNSIDYQNLLNPAYRNDVSKKALATGDYNGVLLNDYIPSISNNYIRNSIMMMSYGSILKADENLDANYKRYMELSTNEDHKKTYTDFYNKRKQLAPGQPSPTFNFENHKGGTTSLNDLKGKYVYIDVWATWCGPCKAQIPYLQEVEKVYHDKNIAFVSISVDTKKNYDKWRDFVSENNLVGIQLIADNDWKSTFVTGYQILGIPRFILIDPDGNIVSSDAPRPSDKRLKDLFDKLAI